MILDGISHEKLSLEKKFAFNNADLVSSRIFENPSSAFLEGVLDKWAELLPREKQLQKRAVDEPEQFAVGLSELWQLQQFEVKAREVQRV